MIYQAQLLRSKMVIGLFLLNLFFVSFFPSHDQSLNVLFFLISNTIIVSAWIQFKRSQNIALSSVCVFFYLFFFVAPLLQINSFSDVGGYFPNTLMYAYDITLYCTFLTLIFLVVFFGTFFVVSRKTNNIVCNIGEQYSEEFSYSNLAKGYLIISIAMLPVLFATGAGNYEEGSVSTHLLKKGLFMLPLFPAMLYANKGKWREVGLIFVLSILLLVIYKNPLFEKRNGLGPIYLSVLVMLFPKFWRSNLNSFISLFLALIIVFPLVSVITHQRAHGIEDFLSLNLSGVKALIVDSFFELHYDAFSNVIAAILYVKDYGISYGGKLIGAFLFFVPRDVWPDKPLNSGMELGNYLIYNYHMDYNNLSAPIVAEAYLNFGFFGVVLFAIALAVVVSWLGRWQNSSILPKKFFGVYFSFHLIFLLRGDLMNAIAYLAGPLLVVYVAPLAYQRIKRIKRFIL